MDLSIGAISEPDKLDKELKLINGVVETGIFCGIADMAIIADGEAVEVIVRSQRGRVKSSINIKTQDLSRFGIAIINNMKTIFFGMKIKQYGG
jgi:hypothetical protein